MDLISTKVLVLVLLGSIRLLFGLAPLKLTRTLKAWEMNGVSQDHVDKRKRQVDLAVSLCLCFGGGVLFATCFVHMVPEVRESMEDIKRMGGSMIPPGSTFPFAELIICIGFFIVYVIEELSHRLLHRNGSSNEEDKVVSEAGDSSMKSVLVVLALSFHAIFEGLGIGVQPSSRDVWYLFGAMSIHGCAIVFCIGMELATSGAKVLKVVLCMCVLALVSPLGTVIGIFVTLGSAQDSVVQASIITVLQGIAGGTILYITFFEVLDRARKKDHMLTTLFMILGFVVMVVLQAVGGHGHTDNSAGTPNATTST